MKGCGKSAPRTRQRGRHGKPHREQDRIGAARPPSPQRDGRGSSAFPRRRSGWSREASGQPASQTNGHRLPFGAGYRTRLTGHLALFPSHLPSPSQFGQPAGAHDPKPPSGGGYPMPTHGGTHLPPPRPFGRVGMGRHGRMTASSTGRMRPPLPPHPAVRRAFPRPSPGCARPHPHFPQTNPQPVDNCGAISHAVPCRTALSHPRFYAVGGGRFGGVTNHGSVTFS